MRLEDYFLEKMCAIRREVTASDLPRQAQLATMFTLAADLLSRDEAREFGKKLVETPEFSPKLRWPFPWPSPYASQMDDALNAVRIKASKVDLRNSEAAQTKGVSS